MTRVIGWYLTVVDDKGGMKRMHHIPNDIVQDIDEWLTELESEEE